MKRSRDFSARGDAVRLRIVIGRYDVPKAYFSPIKGCAARITVRDLAAARELWTEIERAIGLFADAQNS